VEGETKMKFESKYLIRWGIPGWVFILWMSFIILYAYPDYATKLFEHDPTKLLGIFVTFIGLGVPVGYLIHQIYFSLMWYIKNKELHGILKHIQKSKKENMSVDEVTDHHERYFLIEHKWHMEMAMLNKDSRNYLNERFSYLLSTTHGFGVLSVSLSLSALITLIYIVAGKCTGILILIFVIQIVLSALSFGNYNYYSKNSMAYQGRVLNELLDNDDIKEKINKANDIDFPKGN
jgi:hypothetical protein